MKHLNENFEALIEYLHQVEAYPFTLDSPIIRLETHISEVFLAGDFAYKIKKPVDFGFLDFSTLKKREFYCHKEWEYNHSFSPELYLGVVPIIKIKGGDWIIDPKNAEDGEIIEWAVKMRRLDPESLFSNLLIQEKLEKKDIADLGWHLAEVHKKAIKSPIGFNDAHTLLEIVEEDTFQTKDFPETVLSQENHKKLDSLFKEFLEDNKELLNVRVNKGMIRECHGDLHLGNVAKLKNKVILFDCIEFNENFRHIDVIYDVAFLAMDLFSKKRKDLASEFLSSYFDCRFDLLGAQLLNFYMALRAFIRGKVLHFQDKSEEAKVYFDWALECLETKGEIFLVSGLSGSGKSTVGKLLAKKVGALHLRSDVMRKQMAGLLPNEQAPKSIYSSKMTLETYSSLIEGGVNLAKMGLKVVLDAKFDRLDYLKKLFESCQRNQLPLKGIRCEAPKKVLYERIEKRKNDYSDATTDLIEDQIKADEWQQFDRCDDFFILDTSKEWETVLTHWLIS